MPTEDSPAIRNSPVHLSGLAITAKLANAMIGRGYRLILTGFDTMPPRRLSVRREPPRRHPGLSGCITARTHA